MRKYARIFVHEHYLFRENCDLRGTDNVQGQMSEYLLRQKEAIVFITLQIFFAATRAVLNTREYSRTFPSCFFFLSYFSVFFCYNRVSNMTTTSLRTLVKFCKFSRQESETRRASTGIVN